MDPKIAKKTQDTLGKIIKKPPLTDKLLAKPPFRFLHDVMTSVIKTTGFMKGLYTEAEMNSENVKEKDGKIAFLQKSIDMVSAVLGQSTGAKPAKVVAGHEPEKTNEFLQALAAAINAKVDNDEYVKKVLSGGGGGGEPKKDRGDREEKKDKERTRSASRKKDDDKRRKEDKEKSHDREKDREKRHRDRDRDRDGDKEEEKERHRDKREKSREDRHRDRDKDKDRRKKPANNTSAPDVEHNSSSNTSEVRGSKQTVTERSAEVRVKASRRSEKGSPGSGSSLMMTPQSPTKQRSDIGGGGKRQGSRKAGAPPPDVGPPLVKMTQNRSKASKQATSASPEKHKPAPSPTKNENKSERSSGAGNSASSTPRGAVREAVQGSSSYPGDLPEFDGPQRKRRDGQPSEKSRQQAPGAGPQERGRGARRRGGKGGGVRALPVPAGKAASEISHPAVSQAKDGSCGGKAKAVSVSPSQPPVNKGAQPAGSRVSGAGLDVDAENGASNLIGGTGNRRKQPGSSPLAGRDQGEALSRSNVSDLSPTFLPQLSSTPEAASQPISSQKAGKPPSGTPAGGKRLLDVPDVVGPPLLPMVDDGGGGVTGRCSKVKAKASLSHLNLPLEEASVFLCQSATDVDDINQKELEEKENESPEQNGDKDASQDAPSRLQRPTSAKGSRRRRQGREARDDDDEEFQQRDREPAISENDLPPQVTAARKMGRPPSARPAPPRPRQDGVEAEPAMRLGTGAPTNLIVDDGKQSDDEDENFLVEETAPPPPPAEPVSAQVDPEEDAEHGALVKKMLESKKEAEQQQQQPARKTEIERPTMSDAQRRKQRELVAKEIERLQTSIQSLTRSANPLGKIMDYVQEDMDSMQKELDRWRSENKEHALALRRERNVTDRAIEPLKAQLQDIDRAITDQLDLIAATKSNIIRNDHRIEKMLQSIAQS